MAGEITSAGIEISYAPEDTVNVRPTSGYKQKATGAALNIAEYVTNIAGIGAEPNPLEVTTLSADRRQFIDGLEDNSGSVTMNANINPTSRDSWEAIVAEHEALTGGKSMWWQLAFRGDTRAYFLRGKPQPMPFPDVEAGSAVQGNIQIIESGTDKWQDRVTT